MLIAGVPLVVEIAQILAPRMVRQLSGRLSGHCVPTVCEIVLAGNGIIQIH